MNGIQRRNVGNNEKPFPGCLGRMVNLFDLSTGVSRNKLLTDAPHREGSTLSRNQADVGRMFNQFTNQTEDNLTVPELLKASNKRANETSVKMLIDQEMSEMVSTKNPPNVVAKLMGLETLPHQLPDSSVQRNSIRSYPKSKAANYGMSLGCREQSGFLEEGMKCEVNECSTQKEYKDVYEIWQQSPQTNYIRERETKKGVESEIVTDRKMALVRQKFVEAKRLATSEKLRQSKEFQDALEVLSSNKDLFVKFLQEPNSLFTQHLKELQSIPPSPETKRITVLRPSKVFRDERFSDFEKKNYRQLRLPAQRTSALLDKSDPRFSPTPTINRTNEYAVAAQPTRIVVLKPSPGRNHDVKAMVSSPGSLPRVVQEESFHEGFEDDDVKESRKFARNITQKMCDNLSGHRRDETLLSSVFSNGYTGDESSFEKSENDYAVETLSDLEVMSFSSHHSWEYVNRYSSPFSSSSFSRISCSPESSVCREAKKRLSERWAMMTSRGNYQEQRHVRRHSNTLGEMLALSDAKKSIITDNEVNGHKTGELEPYFNSDENIECLDGSPTTLVRSKSVPGSSALIGGLNLEASDLVIGKTDDPKLLAKPKGVKSSFNEKVSSLFFSRNKKMSKEKRGGSQTKDESQSSSVDTPSSLSFVHHSRGLSNAASHSNDGEGCSSGTSLHSANKVARGGAVHHEAGLSMKRPFTIGNAVENQEQPSPISVLEPPFSEDDYTHLELSSYIKPGNHEFCTPFKNSLIDKSPPIESVARSIFWGDSYSDSFASYALKSSPVSTCLEEEQNWHCLVEALLTMSDLSSEVQQCGFLFTRWHSLVNPLDPSLRDKYANLSNKEPMLEAKRRQVRSNRKLVFDCVNAALIDITSQELDHRRSAETSSRAHDSSFTEGTPLTLLDCVMGKLKDWVCGESRCVTGEIGDSNSLVVERVVRKEVGGKFWDDHLTMEMDNLGKEVERRLLEELLEEAVVQLTGKCD
ncbi:uncharacterized protein LOC111437361 isoform X1 [Cucurbita moschata]|uniref:Uncharacterized protein LOC111437361 isoform X1 n=2 Tax=Cucurbita moschata TaxID=3662 RepID=A0A6J1ET88_CUCMO|nr:uncharacterized protein LOC111437361 isoform X1 [Cucurbita moschata]XP_022931053.1 uncharacterized protein LOC111437361 isoform X1 [Cucurbita moschata]XP_022931054.1 uncharacterized protein LOC111437361 isoform X1 [Cucurbita moschata]